MRAFKKTGGGRLPWCCRHGYRLATRVGGARSLACRPFSRVAASPPPADPIPETRQLPAGESRRSTSSPPRGAAIALGLPAPPAVRQYGSSATVAFFINSPALAGLIARSTITPTAAASIVVNTNDRVRSRRYISFSSFHVGMDGSFDFLVLFIARPSMAVRLCRVRRKSGRVPSAGGGPIGTPAFVGSPPLCDRLAAPRPRWG